MWGYVNPMDAFPLMSAHCSRQGGSKYDCKVRDVCDCGRDEDAFESFERLNVASARRPHPWQEDGWPALWSGDLARDRGDG